MDAADRIRARALFELAVDVMQRSHDVGNNKAILDAIAATKLNTVVGHIEWEQKNLPPFAREKHRQDAARRRSVAAA